MTDECLICGAAYAPFGFWDGYNYTWFCPLHQYQGKAIPKSPAPRLDAVPPSPQGELSLGIILTGKAAFLDFLQSGTWPWPRKLVAFIQFMVEEGSNGGSGGEVWRLQSEEWIGPPPNPNVVGNAIDTAGERGLIVKTGRYVAPRSKKSHASKKAEWVRTDKK